MIKIFVTILLFITTTTFAQSNKYVILGLVKEPISAGTKLTAEGITNNSKYLKDKTIVLVAGLSFIKNEEIYEVYHNSDTLFIPASNLILDSTKQENLRKFNNADLDSLRKVASYAAMISYEDELNKVLKPIDRTKPYGLCIFEWSHYDESEYTEGSSVKIQAYNTSNKTIKYIWFSFIGYNAVDDKVSSRGKVIQTYKGIGPIKPKTSASYTFEYVWLNDLVETAKISSIKIQYMDGSIKLISTPNKIILSSEELSNISEIHQ
jgi:hypothetical protein